LEAFDSNGANIECLRIFSYGCGLLGKDSTIHALIGGSFDKLCQVIMSKAFKGNQTIDNVNIDIVRCFAELLHKIAEADVSILLQSNSFHDVLLLFYETVVHVNEKDANNELVLFFSYIISNRQC
jgi:hypothetical protein